MTKYVLGFVFSEPRLMVAMITKRRPAWQAGRINGIGGKVEAGELAQGAMRREFREETGVDIPEQEWEHKISMSARERFEMDVFRAFSPDVQKVTTKTDEKVQLMSVNHVFTLIRVAPDLFIDNMAWVLPLVLDDKPQTARICYPG